MDTVSQTKENALAPVVVGLIRALSLEREAHESTRFVLHEALALMADQDRKLDRERANRLHLLDQYRAAMSGRTNAEERQALDEAREMQLLEGAVTADHPRAA